MQYVTDEDYARCIRETPHGETPECFKGWGMVELRTGERVPIEAWSPRPGVWAPATPEEMNAR